MLPTMPEGNKTTTPIPKKMPIPDPAVPKVLRVPRPLQEPPNLPTTKRSLDHSFNTNKSGPKPAFFVLDFENIETVSGLINGCPVRPNRP